MEQKVRQNLVKAIKSKNSLESSVLRLIINQIQTAIEQQAGKPLTPAQEVNIIKLLINQNNEEIRLRQGNENYLSQIENLTASNIILAEYLPEFLSVEKIKEILTESLSEIKQAKSENAAIGVAMKLLKPHSVEGPTVKSVVIELYSSNN